MNQSPSFQRGGVWLGVIVGVLVGLGVAMAVAVYIAKVPTPFSSSKSHPRGAEQDAAEAQKNKDWNPNAPLSFGKPAEKENDKPQSDVPSPSAEDDKTMPSDKTSSKAETTAKGDYVVQMGAFGKEAEAQAQHAKLTLAGFDVSIESRDQSGRKVYRLRSDPLDKTQAEQLRERVSAAGFDALVVKARR